MSGLPFQPVAHLNTAGSSSAWCRYSMASHAWRHHGSHDERAWKLAWSVRMNTECIMNHGMIWYGGTWELLLTWGWIEILDVNNCKHTYHADHVSFQGCGLAIHLWSQLIQHILTHPYPSVAVFAIQILDHGHSHCDSSWSLRSCWGMCGSSKRFLMLCGGNPGYPQSLVPRKYGSYVVFYPILWYIMWYIYITYTYYIDILIHPHFYSHDMSICVLILWIHCFKAKELQFWWLVQIMMSSTGC
jgi:hypothetical protein